MVVYYVQVPSASSVRPLSVLRASLAHVRARLQAWDPADQSNRSKLYGWEQLKSIRQDLTVQALRTPFTVQVYEAAARLALLPGDQTEFNNCQCCLKELYRELLDGELTDSGDGGTGTEGTTDEWRVEDRVVQRVEGR